MFESLYVICFDVVSEYKRIHHVCERLDASASSNDCEPQSRTPHFKGKGVYIAYLVKNESNMKKIRQSTG